MATNFDTLQKGDKLSETTYYEVVGKNANGIHGHSLNVVTSTGQQLSITKDLVEKLLVSADQYTEEKKVTKTELANILVQAGDTVFTATYHKLPEAKHINQEIDGLNAGKFPTNSQMKATISKAFEGKERIIRGKLVSIETLFGRVLVNDLDLEFNKEYQGSTVRWVDLRSLTQVIYRNVKYILK